MTDRGHATVKWAIRDVRHLRHSDATEVFAKIARIEKKTFPANEAFLFDEKLFKQHNANVLFVSEAVDERYENVLAYAVCIRSRQTMLLHKVCVAEGFRGRGMGKYLVKELVLRARAESCRSIDLCVDESKAVARQLYVGFGFQELQPLPDYYAPGRHAVKMSLQL